jgi:hypothetical protein
MHEITRTKTCSRTTQPVWAETDIILSTEAGRGLGSYLLSLELYDDDPNAEKSAFLGMVALRGSELVRFLQPGKKDKDTAARDREGYREFRLEVSPSPSPSCMQYTW